MLACWTNTSSSHKRSYWFNFVTLHALDVQHSEINMTRYLISIDTSHGENICICHLYWVTVLYWDTHTHTHTCTHTHTHIQWTANILTNCHSLPSVYQEVTRSLPLHLLCLQAGEELMQFAQLFYLLPPSRQVQEPPPRWSARWIHCHLSQQQPAKWATMQKERQNNEP